MATATKTTTTTACYNCATKKPRTTTKQLCSRADNINNFTVTVFCFQILTSAQMAVTSVTNLLRASTYQDRTPVDVALGTQAAGKHAQVL